MPHETEEFSLVLRGPLYRLYTRLGLARALADPVWRRVGVMVAITWIPLAVLSALTGRATSGTTVVFFTDLGVHARFLLALPLLIIAEVFAHERLRLTVEQFLDRELVAPGDHARFSQVLQSQLAMCESTSVEIAILVLSLTGGYWLWRAHLALRAASWYSATGGTGALTVAGYYFAFISLPIFRFVLFRWYFRIFVWYRVLWSMSRLRLNLNALHPDRAGGLGFLSGTTMAFMPVLLAHTVLLAGQIGDHIWYEGATLPQFKMEIGAIIAFLVLLVFAPLTFFFPQLEHARRLGSREYGTIANGYVNRFREKWIRRAQPADESILGSSDIQSLADLGNSFAVITEMRLVPFTKASVVRLGLLLLAPLLPLALTMIPLDQITERALKLVFA